MLKSKNQGHFQLKCKGHSQIEMYKILEHRVLKETCKSKGKRHVNIEISRILKHQNLNKQSKSKFKGHLKFET